MLGEAGVRLGQHLAGDRHVGRHRHAGERAVAPEGGELLRLLPAQAAAENAAAAAQLHRHEVVVGGREPRSGEADQHAAVVDPARQLAALLVRDRSDVGQNDHRHALLDEHADRLRGRSALAEPHVGERSERAREKVGGGEQRLRRVGGRAGDDADRAPAPALVEQLHRAGRALGYDVEPGDVVADLDRQVELRLGFALAALEREARLAERQALEVERAHGAVVVRAGVGAQHFHAQHAGRVVGGRERMGAAQAAHHDGDRASRPRGATRPSTNSLAWPMSTPSVSQISSTLAVAVRNRPIAGSASARSTV